MATTFEVLYLGLLSRIDTVQGNETVENAAALLGTYGSSAAPLHQTQRVLSANDLAEDDNTTYDLDNGGGYDSFRINGGAPQNFDAVAIYDATITYVDGTTATITAVIFQDTSGNTYLAPETTANADQAALTALPIQSLTLTAVSVTTGDMAADRVAGDFKSAVDGTAGNDIMLQGFVDAQGDAITTGSDYINGGAGNDSINADAGNDTIFGGAGNDTIDDWTGNDLVYGGDGNDVADVSSGNDTIFMDAGDDRVNLWDNTGTKVLDGGTGNDTLDFRNWQTSSGTSVTVGATGSGSYTHSTAGTTGTFTGFEVISGTDFNDTLNASANTTGITLIGEAGNDSLTGGSGADSLSGGADADTLVGGAGNDTLDDGAGNDSVSAGDGNDVATVGAGNDTISMDAGDDLVNLWDSAGVKTLDGGTGNDTLDFRNASTTTGTNVTVGSTGSGSFTHSTTGTTGTFAAFEVISGTDFNDTLNAASNTTGISLVGEGGNDSLTGGSGNDTLNGGAGNDTISDGAGNDSVTAGDGNDVVTVGSGNDSISMDAGDDLVNLWDSAGVKTLYGGTGSDTLDFRNASTTTGTNVTVGATGSGSFTHSTAGTTGTFTGFEVISGTDFNDTLNASANATGISLVGEGGNDSLTGGSGNDTLNGGAGNDTISDGAGNDSVTAGDGNDVVTVGSGNDSISMDAGDDLVNLWDSAGVKTLDGGTGNDTLDFRNASTTTGTNVTVGATGSGSFTHSTTGTTGTFTGFEVISGTDFNDTLNASANTTGIMLLGEAGNDLLTGGSGRDTLNGGAGTDTLTGGAGADVFIADGTADRITDFDTVTGIGDGTSANNDFVDLSAYYNDTTLAAWNAANPTQRYANPLAWAKADLQDGTLNAAGGLQLVGVTGSGLSVENTAIVCFAAGTLIDTATGQRPVESLRPGDLIRTLDHGFQPLRWMASRRLGAADFDANPKLRPIRIKRHALGGKQPARDLLVSPQHRILVASKIALRVTGHAEVFVPAVKLIGMEGIDWDDAPERLTYYHLLFRHHEIVFSNGLLAESLFLGSQTQNVLGRKMREELVTRFPDLAPSFLQPVACRFIADGKAAKQIVHRHGKNAKPLQQLRLKQLAIQAKAKPEQAKPRAMQGQARVPMRSGRQPPQITDRGKSGKSGSAGSGPIRLMP